MTNQNPIILKIGPPSKISPLPLSLTKVVAKGASVLKVHPPILAVVHAVVLKKAPKKQYLGLTNESRHHYAVIA